MKRKEMLDSIQAMDEKQMVAKINELKQELFSLRFQKASGNLENASSIKNIKIEIARIKTVMNKKEAGDQ
jgi:large subunit ribosomal protein L29